jgi:hypothetical protein
MKQNLDSPPRIGQSTGSGLLLRAVVMLAAMSAIVFALSPSDLFASGSGICKVLGLLPYGGAVVMTVGGSMAAYNYMSHDAEAKQKGKAIMEGLIIGGAILLVLPMLVSFFTGTSVC